MVTTKVMVVVEEDPAIDETKGRMWVECQKAGKNVQFFNVKTQYPFKNSVELGVDLFRRSGAGAIIAIGSSAVTDLAKGIRRVLESDAECLELNHFEDPRDYRLFDEGKMPLGYTRQIPLAILATSVSPCHFADRWATLRNEDVLFTYKHARVPEV
jgi:alcohol dehydrogenase class IV